MSIEQIKQSLLLIQEFHEKFNIQKFDREKQTFEEYRVFEQLRYTLLREEFDELISAMVKRDPVAVYDAIGDLIYIALGTIYLMNDEKYLMEYLNIKDFVKIRETVFGLSSGNVNNSDISVFISALEKQVEKSKSYATLACVTVLFILTRWGKTKIIPHIFEIFKLIHESNMSKLGADGKPILREDGKILKGPNYKPVDIKGFLIGKMGYDGTERSGNELYDYLFEYVPGMDSTESINRKYA